MKRTKFIKKHLNAIYTTPGAWQEMLDMLYQRSLQKMMIEERRRQGLSRQHLADRMGTTVASIWILETTRYPNYEIGTLQRWARALGLSLDIGAVDVSVPQDVDEDVMANACFRFHDAEACVPGLNHPQYAKWEDTLLVEKDRP